MPIIYWAPIVSIDTFKFLMLNWFHIYLLFLIEQGLCVTRSPQELRAPGIRILDEWDSYEITGPTSTNMV